MSPKLAFRHLLLALLLIGAMTVTLLPTAAFAAPAGAPVASGAYHRVVPGETLSHIARRYGVTVNALVAANGLKSANYIYVGQHIYIPPVTGTPAGCASYYRVKPGDNLSRVAAWYGIKTYALASANGLGNANYIYVGQKLCIPNIYGGPSYPSYPGDHYGDHHGGYHDGGYIVKAGDTLSEIAAWNGLSVHKLMYLNGLSNPNYVYVGQHLRLW